MINRLTQAELAELTRQISDGGITTSADNYTSAFSQYATTSNSNPPRSGICRLCGKKSLLSNIDLCPVCQPLLEREKIKELIRGLIPENSKEHCLKCLSHVRACVCEPNKQLEKLGN